MAIGAVYLTSSPSGGGSAMVADSHDEHGAWAYAQLFVSERLKAPSTAVFPYGGGSQHVRSLGGGRYRVDSYVDSQNGFGATVRQPFQLVIKRLPGKWQLESLEFAGR